MMGGWKYVLFWLGISFLGGLWLIQKTIVDNKHSITWEETNKKLDKIIILLEKK
jgi:hypothetical protein